MGHWILCYTDLVVMDFSRRAAAFTLKKPICEKQKAVLQKINFYFDVNEKLCHCELSNFLCRDEYVHWYIFLAIFLVLLHCHSESEKFHSFSYYLYIHFSFLLGIICYYNLYILYLFYIYIHVHGNCINHSFCNLRLWIWDW